MRLCSLNVELKCLRGLSVLFCAPVVHVRVCRDSQLHVASPQEVFVRLCFTVWTLDHDMLPYRNNLLRLQHELHWWSEWIYFQTHCCWNDSEYQIGVYLFYKTVVLEAVRVSAGTNWGHHQPLKRLCSSERRSLPDQQTLIQDSESQLNRRLIRRKGS